MSDIAQRLRDTATARKTATPFDEPGHYLNVIARVSREDGMLMDEAAHTIEALQAENAKMRETLVGIIVMTDAAACAPLAAERWLDRIEEDARAALTDPAVPSED